MQDMQSAASSIFSLFRSLALYVCMFGMKTNIIPIIKLPVRTWACLDYTWNQKPETLMSPLRTKSEVCEVSSCSSAQVPGFHSCTVNVKSALKPSNPRLICTSAKNCTCWAALGRELSVAPAPSSPRPCSASRTQSFRGSELDTTCSTCSEVVFMLISSLVVSHAVVLYEQTVF